MDGNLDRIPNPQRGMPKSRKWNMTNLNVDYLPGGGEANLYPSISPVNSFRVIFNTDFGGQLPLLTDKACNFSPSGPFGWTIQVDPDPQCTALLKP